MPSRDKDSSYKDRVFALRLLRENMLLSQPNKYSLTDIAEDLPGPARAVAPIFKNVLPSQAIISSDPEERKKQISDAVSRIRASGGSSSGLGKEILTNVKNLGLGGLAAGTGIAALTKLLGVRGITRKLPSGKMKWQSPIAPMEAIRGMIKKPRTALEAAKESLHEGSMGGALGALHGALVPLAAHGYKVSDKALAEAQQVMQEQPQITALPAAEMLSVLKGDKQNHHSSKTLDILKNTALGAGLGLAGGLAHATVPSILKAVGYGAKNLVTRRPLAEGIKSMLKDNLGRDLNNAARWGTGIGALSGALTKRIDSDEQPTASSYTA